MDKRENNDLYEQYIDATVALFMEHYSSALTERVKSEVMSQDSVDISPELDRRCRALIQRECAKQKRKTVFKGFVKGVSYAAAMLLVVLSLGSVLFFTVDAVRIPIVNFFIEHGDGFLLLTGKEDDVSTGPEDSLAQDAFDEYDPLKGLIPEDYSLKNIDVHNTDVSALYLDPFGSKVYFQSTTSDSSLMVDSENAEFVTETMILDCEAILIKAEELSLTWIDSSRGIIYLLIADSLSEQELMNIAKTITIRYRG